MGKDATLGMISSMYSFNKELNGKSLTYQNHFTLVTSICQSEYVTLHECFERS